MDNTLRTALLSLHRTLLDFERRAYEKANGRVASGEFLQVAMRDPALAWLAPLTSLIARLDEIGEGSDFAAQCTERSQLSPDVAFAYAAARHALSERDPARTAPLAA